jgi:hypothetical protein
MAAIFIIRGRTGIHADAAWLLDGTVCHSHYVPAADAMDQIMDGTALRVELGVCRRYRMK